MNTSSVLLPFLLFRLHSFRKLGILQYILRVEVETTSSVVQEIPNKIHFKWRIKHFLKHYTVTSSLFPNFWYWSFFDLLISKSTCLSALGQVFVLYFCFRKMDRIRFGAYAHSSSFFDDAKEKGHTIHHKVVNSKNVQFIPFT